MRQRWLVGAVAALTLVAAAASAQTSTRVRGTIVSIDGATLMVKSRDGRALKIELADALTVAVAKAARFEDIKEGDFVGVTTTKQADGTNVALEIHYLAPTVPAGQTPADLQPGATMTNATVASKVTATGAREITLSYKDGSHRIMVPEGAPIVRSVPGSRADLVAGEYVFAAVQAGPGEALTAARIQVSKDGVRPPQ